MDRSMISMIYFVALLALFLIMIIATIAVIASKSKRRYEDDDEFEDDEFEDSENEDEGAGITAGDETIFSDAALLKCAGLRRPLLFAAGDALRRAGLIEHTALPRDITEFTALAERIKR